LVAFVGAIAVQFIGGHAAGNRCRYSVRIRLLIFGISIALYTAFGGFRASVLNDTMQGMVMLMAPSSAGGVVHAAGAYTCGRKLQHIDPKLVTPQGR
jgi:sodium/pantothenate symporter